MQYFFSYLHVPQSWKNPCPRSGTGPNWQMPEGVESNIYKPAAQGYRVSEQTLMWQTYKHQSFLLIARISISLLLCGKKVKTPVLQGFRRHLANAGYAEQSNIRHLRDSPHFQN
jgi:hypothetical protein